VLRWVPKDAAFVVVSKRLGDAATVAREIAMPFLIGFNLDDDGLGRELAASVGVDVLSPNGLAAAGLDQNASAAAFAHGGAMIYVVGVSDAPVLQAFLDHRREQKGARVTVHRDHEITAVEEPSGARTSWTVLDDWLVIRSAAGGSGAAWLDPLLQASTQESFAATGDFASARNRAAKRLGDAVPGVLGVARTRRLARGYAGLLPEGFAPCAAAVADAVPKIFAYASAGWEDGKGAVEFKLSKKASASVAAAIGPDPGLGLKGLRPSHGISASFALSFAWIHQMRQASGCPALARPIEDPAAAMGWRPPPSGYHAALSALDLDKLEGEGAVAVTIKSRAFLDRQLGSIPGRSLFDRKKNLAGHSIRKFDLPGYDPIYYKIRDTRVDLATSKDRLKALLSDAPAAAGGPREVAFLRLVPSRFRRLGDLMSAIYARMGYRSTVGAERQAQRLARYEWAELALELDGGTLRLSASMKLKP